MWRKSSAFELMCLLREGVKKNWEKAVRLTAWVDPPLPSPEAVRKMWKFLDKLPYLGLFCRFIKDKNGSKFSQIEVVRLRGGDPPSPPKAVSLTAFSQFFFYPFPYDVNKSSWTLITFVNRILFLFSPLIFVFSLFRFVLPLSILFFFSSPLCFSLPALLRALESSRKFHQSHCLASSRLIN